MAEYIAIPKLGMAMADATILHWKAKEGEWVEEHQPVVVIETEKVECELEASAAGFLHILVAEGNKMPVGRVIGLLAASKEELEALQKEPPKEIFIRPREAVEAAAVEVAPPKAVVTRERGEERIRISPVARKMAEEHAIDITKITGTGPGGRIVREDIERAIEAREKAPPVEVYEGKRVKAAIPLKGMRRAIAEHMHRSLSVSAQLTFMGEIDMTEVIKLRDSLLAREEAIGARITYTDIFVLALARALKDNPLINSSLIGNEIKLWEDINIGVAVALEDGLIVPVVKNADKKSLLEINQTIGALVRKAREGKLMPDDVTGNTFTLTNIGAFGGGWGFATPIINQPDSAILGTGAITERAVVREGQIVIRPIMTYSFTFDHRVIDGAPAGKFMARVTELLENPSLLLL
jgi:pyruvate dehydrogenase E2 component (dihydrolipoamide acetyltransferase)/2-oxoglutarate dehydrogenase E2 component (dihydrolipoamide succinyltransferase)